MGKFIEAVLRLIIAFFIGGVASLVGAIPVYFLWNWLCPSLFDLPGLTFWQALGLLWLSTCLVKSSTTCECDKK